MMMMMLLLMMEEEESSDRRSCRLRRCRFLSLSLCLFQPSSSSIGDLGFSKAAANASKSREIG